ncbi:MAG TPA: ATP-binding protein, partial [Polyangiaceae bacterium]
MARILLVDDHPQNLLALEAILAPFGHRLVRASSGAEALKALLAEEFALILLDVQMPGFDGFETAELIRSHGRTAAIPIIFITAIHRSPAHIHRGYASGAVDYIVKPLDPEILRSKVAVFVDLYQKNRLIKQQAKMLHDQEVVSLEMRYRNLTEALPLPLWAERLTGETYYSNRAFLDYTGVDPMHARGLLTPRLVHPDDKAKVIFEATRPRQNDAFEIEIRLRRHDGNYRWHMVRSVREQDGKGRIVICADIDDRRKSEDALALVVGREREARKRAEEADRSKDAFLATVSHELRTPLNAIMGWAQLLVNGELEGEELGRAYETIERNAKSQSRLISDLFDVSRMMSGKTHLDRKPTSLGKLVNDVVESLQPSIQAREVVIDVRSEGGESLVNIDASRVQQVVWNLLTNAIKFGAKSIRVDLRNEPNAAVVRVVDDGQGIDASFLPNVFDRFEQADSTSTREKGGLGLGLSIVKHLVELHGGTVTVESDGVGKGATFVVSIPVARSGAHAIGPAAKEARTELGGTRILVVDDDDDGRLLLAKILDRSGGTVTAVRSFAEALAELERD